MDAYIRGAKGGVLKRGFSGDCRLMSHHACARTEGFEDTVKTVPGVVVEGSFLDGLTAKEVVSMGIHGVFLAQRAESVGGHQEACEREMELALEQGLESEVVEAVVLVLAVVECEGQAGQRGHDGGKKGSLFWVDFWVLVDLQLHGGMMGIELGRQSSEWQIQDA